MMLEGVLGSVLVPKRYSRYLILGCALGVAAILVVLSLFANYFRAVETQLLGVHPHLSITPAGDLRTFDDVALQSVERAVATLDGVVAAGPAIDRVVRLRMAAVETHSVICRDQANRSVCFDPSLATSGADGIRSATGFEIDRAKSVRVRLRGLAVDEEQTTPLTLELERVLDVRAEGLDAGRMAVGPAQRRPMAGYFERRLFQGASPLDDFLLLPSLSEVEQHAVEPQHFRLLSTLHLGLRQDPQPLLVTSLDNAKRLLGPGARVDTFEVRLDEPRKAVASRAALQRHIQGVGHGMSVDVRSWLDRDEGALRLLNVLRWVIFVVASSVMVVAALGVMSTLSLVVMEGRRKIAMLRAMGVRDRSLYLALALECVRIAAVGLVSGVLLGAAASWSLLHIPGFLQGLSKMGVADPGVMLRTMDLTAVAAATFLLFLLVAWWPARQACRIHPVSGLRGA